ncbi:hypothetical protein HYH02_006460 [Chlamydomonas schloesseri]|uniref:Uncharacterized protein n=1 Tax=Chlamydomonas schloesseri TaxID=2026947 RepID=A0A836B6C3_9CHLO|nr:hypothetical protein HYH02_006460 [Chlamydomonas schloesseri]|eukprot:KAG2448569.1 hypothetical protein HYH02_006460 [Chlamydomonas schloesseri]
MDFPIAPRVVGFSATEAPLQHEATHEVCKLQTQRSLLSEMLSQYAQDGEYSESEVDDEESYSDDEDAGVSIVRQDTGSSMEPARSEPIAIPCAESFANQRAKDAYRRMMYQRQVEQLYQQQQQQVQQQQIALAQQRQQAYLAQQQRVQQAQAQARGQGRA